MANYLMKYKGKYRLHIELDQNTNDFARNYDDSISDTDVYIYCHNDNKIFTYGHINNTKPVWLIAYIPSIIRGHNIIKVLKEKNIEIVDHRENDAEVEFKFKAADIEIVAELMKAHTYGANISPFSSKNLPKSDVKIPEDKIARYKEITSIVSKNNLHFISRITNKFLEEVLQKNIRKMTKNKKYNYKADMKSLCLGRQTKEFIYVKNFWNEYLDYLQKELEIFSK